ncbi:MAG: lipid-A-disaccharide synthase [Candidatus Omnitrophica bacterium]|nr:lipid-A-disaccharide synthase [Candidatus Omnitrophota bacterium]
MTKKIMLIAGESSGDLHGAHLAAELFALEPDLQLFGFGGSGMKQAGVEILVDPTELAVIGIVEVLRHLGTFQAMFRKAAATLDERRPDVVVLIDYPGFNLRFAREAKTRGIPVVYFISPQIWAWDPGRIHKIKSLVSRMLVVFPFEQKIYEQAGVPVTFVGHPLVEHVKPALSRAESLQQLGLEDRMPVVGLLPGSREGEVRRILPIFLAAGERMQKELPSTTQFLLIKAPHLDWEIYRQAMTRSALKPKVVERWDYSCIHSCDFVLVASGTATLECALLERPMLIAYKTSWPTYFLSRLLIKIPVIGLVNVVASADENGRITDKKIVPEFIQHSASPALIAATAIQLWKEASWRNKMVEDFRKIKHSLGETGASRRAAQTILEELRKAG